MYRFGPCNLNLHAYKENQSCLTRALYFVALPNPLKPGAKL